MFKDLDHYIEGHTSEEPVVLQKLTRETYRDVLMPNMLSGHHQGRFLALLSHLIKPSAILEIGTFTGYSALCLAEGLQEDGKLYTIDINEELEDMVRSYISEAGFDNKIQQIIGNALTVIPSLSHTYDIVFIDADKVNYSNYFDLVIEKVKKGGLIIADNVLWKGKVIDDLQKDKDTMALKAFNEKVLNDVRVDNLILNIRDGLMLIRKK
jgi:caffeoyl-CoA O-methyltransferase